jgi:SAM-dependent MidA family methyltransferase
VWSRFLHLPELTDAEASLLGEMRGRLTAEIESAGGALPFDRYMETALYEPGLGYYVNGRRKFGEAGDFVTAPEVSPLFSRCLARQVAECLRNLGGGSVLEVGAGSGRMATDMLTELETLDALPERYQILELSPSLQQAQFDTLSHGVPHLLPRVVWLTEMPAAGFHGVLVGNELLDAMPVHRFRRVEGAWQELAVGVEGGTFCDRWKPLQSPGLAEALEKLWPDATGVSEGYSSELNMRLAPWLKAVAASLDAGYVILIDYGYAQREYYHVERSLGTLICHFRHRAYADPYLLPGLQDMTANVDFTALAEAAVALGFELSGYTTQAHFLIDSGLEQMLSTSDPNDLKRHLSLMQGVKKLTLPGEMGERFKVMALARGARATLSGFRSRDMRERL